MNEWGAVTYGDPCRECGFAWSTTLDEAVVVVENCPGALLGLLGGASGDERRLDLAWSVGVYVCHVADNLRIWAERLVAVEDGHPAEVGGYDENELAHARRYDSIPLRAAQWSLGRSVEDWLRAVNGSPHTGTLMIHPERGELSLLDVTVSNAHDTFHHLHDVETTLVGLMPEGSTSLPGNRRARGPPVDAERAAASHLPGSGLGQVWCGTDVGV